MGLVRRALPIVPNPLLMGLRLGRLLGLGLGVAMPIVPSTLHMRLRLGKARGWASTRGGSV